MDRVSKRNEIKHTFSLKEKNKRQIFEETHGVTTDDKSSERNDEPTHLGLS